MAESVRLRRMRDPILARLASLFPQGISSMIDRNDWPRNTYGMQLTVEELDLDLIDSADGLADVYEEQLDEHPLTVKDVRDCVSRALKYRQQTPGADLQQEAYVQTMDIGNACVLLLREGDLCRLRQYATTATTDTAPPRHVTAPVASSAAATSNAAHPTTDSSSSTAGSLDGQAHDASSDNAAPSALVNSASALDGVVTSHTADVPQTEGLGGSGETRRDEDSEDLSNADDEDSVIDYRDYGDDVPPYDPELDATICEAYEQLKAEKEQQIQMEAAEDAQDTATTNDETHDPWNFRSLHDVYEILGRIAELISGGIEKLLPAEFWPGHNRVYSREAETTLHEDILTQGLYLVSEWYTTFDAASMRGAIRAAVKARRDAMGPDAPDPFDLNGDDIKAARWRLEKKQTQPAVGSASSALSAVSDDDASGADAPNAPDINIAEEPSDVTVAVDVVAEDYAAVVTAQEVRHISAFDIATPEVQLDPDGSGVPDGVECSKSWDTDHAKANGNTADAFTTDPTAARQVPTGSGTSQSLDTPPMELTPADDFVTESTEAVGGAVFDDRFLEASIESANHENDAGAGDENINMSVGKGSDVTYRDMDSPIIDVTTLAYCTGPMVYKGKLRKLKKQVRPRRQAKVKANQRQTKMDLAWYKLKYMVALLGHSATIYNRGQGLYKPSHQVEGFKVSYQHDEYYGGLVPSNMELRVRPNGSTHQIAQIAGHPESTARARQDFLDIESKGRAVFQALVEHRRASLLVGRNSRLLSDFVFIVHHDETGLEHWKSFWYSTLSGFKINDVPYWRTTAHLSSTRIDYRIPKTLSLRPTDWTYPGHRNVIKSQVFFGDLDIDNEYRRNTDLDHSCRHLTHALIELREFLNKELQQCHFKRYPFAPKIMGLVMKFKVGTHGTYRYLGFKVDPNPGPVPNRFNFATHGTHPYLSFKLGPYPVSVLKRVQGKFPQMTSWNVQVMEDQLYGDYEQALSGLQRHLDNHAEEARRLGHIGTGYNEVRFGYEDRNGILTHRRVNCGSIIRRMELYRS